ncbi:MAG TPA: trigger factor [Anaerolineae bacterium]|nr:trigger factor [Anaerolineae bacterium]
MKVTQEPIADRQVVLTIEVDEERMERALRQAARQLSRRVRIRGFRPGKAPYALVAQAVGEERLYDQALRLLGPQVYEEALAESGIQPYALPPLEVTRRKPPIFQATIPLPPLVELGDYHAIRMTPQEVTVTDEDVDAVLAEIQQDNVQIVPVERPVAANDILTLSLRISQGDRVLLERENVVFDMAEGSNDLPPEVGEALLGMERGQERELTLAYPADHPDERLAGRSATIHVTLHEVKERRLPEIDDELAQTVGDFESLDELRERIRANLQTRREIEARERLAEEVLAAVMAQARVEFPPLMVERELDEMIADYADHLERRGLTLEKALEMQGKSEQELRDELRVEARERVRRALVLGRVVEQEGIELEPGEVEEESEAIAQSFGERAEEAREALASEESRRSLTSQLLAQKALRRLVEIATAGEEPESGG